MSPQVASRFEFCILNYHQPIDVDLESKTKKIRGLGVYVSVHHDLSHSTIKEMLDGTIFLVLVPFYHLITERRKTMGSNPGLLLR